MGNNKITVTFTVDKDIWKISKYKLPCSRSKYLEDCLRRAIYSDNEIDRLEKEIASEEAEIMAKKEKLQKLKEFRTANSSNEKSIKKAMITVHNITSYHNSISTAQIIHIAESNFLNPDVLTDVIKKEGIKITEYTQEEKETTVKKSKTIYNSR